VAILDAFIAFALRELPGSLIGFDFDGPTVSGLPYLSFDLLIERAEPDDRVRVLASPAGETRPIGFDL
jgi:hypothetical protein